MPAGYNGLRAGSDGHFRSFHVWPAYASFSVSALIPEEVPQPEGPLETGDAPYRLSCSGISDLNGNVWERVISRGHVLGRAFSGVHGMGTTDARGYAAVAGWPGPDAFGSGYRGGAWNSPEAHRHTDNRLMAAFTFAQRHKADGFRGVRTAPLNTYSPHQPLADPDS